MPKAAMNKDRCMEPGKHDVRATEYAAGVEAITETSRVEGFPQGDLR